MAEKGVIEMIVDLSKTEDVQFSILNNLLWAMGNIFADSPQYRDRIIDAGGIEALLKIVEKG